MNWIKVDLNSYQKIRTLDKLIGGVCYNLSPRQITPIDIDGFEVNGEVIEVRLKKELCTYDLFNLVVEQQKLYDKSDEVNCFIYNGNKYWFDKETRLGLVNSIKVQQDSGLTTTILWLNDIACQVSIDYALRFLKDLELYAIQCYNVTQNHLLEIKNLNYNVGSLLDYNISSGYPQPIEFDSNEIINE